MALVGTEPTRSKIQIDNTIFGKMNTSAYLGR